MKMKQILNRLFLFGILGSFVLLYSCGEDDPEEPTINPPSISFTVTGGTANADLTEVSGMVGTPVVWNFTIGAPGGFNTFRIEGLAQTAEFTRNDLSLDAGATTANVEVSTDFTSAGTVTLTLTAVDDANQVTTATVLVTITGTPAKSLTAQLLFVPNANGDIQDSKTFFSSTVTIDDKNTFSVDDVQTDAVAVNSIDIDFGFFQGASTAINIASPSNYAAYDLDALGWVALNETNMKLTSLDADAFVERTTVEQIQAEYDAVTGDPVANLNNLTVGQVIAMKTDADKAGGSKTLLVLIKDQVDANNNGEFDDVGDYIELEILIEE